MAYGTVNADVIGTSVAGSNLGAGNATRFKNRLINSNMVIDQRNAGASVTNIVGAVYTVDRWAAVGYAASKFTAQQNAGSVTPPLGFTNYLGCTSSSAYTVGSSEYFGIAQYIEGLNVTDLAWGTANAKTVTLSAWVYSSLTGTFGGSLRNSADTYNYPFSYSIPTANTWTQISITVAGPTTGTWLTTNGVGIRTFFSLGAGATFSGTAGSWTSTSTIVSATGAVSVVGTSGATFYITGVQLEVGSSATGFEFVDYTTQLIMCQRYCPVIPVSTPTTGTAVNSNTAYAPFSFTVRPRVAPTSITAVTNYGSSLNAGGGGAGAPVSLTVLNIGLGGVRFQYTTSPADFSGGTPCSYTTGQDIIFNGSEL